ncbi:MAG: SOS response-associated peptidase, partial [Gemmataceae bacterium]
NPESNKREIVSCRWGLLPSWSDEPKTGFLNARSETVATKPAFRSSFRKRRCLIPATGFYEWKKHSNGHKYPFYFRLASGLPMAFAGLWDRWKREDVVIESCTVLTTEANALLRPLHDRMPVILHSADFEKWLDPGSDDAGVTTLFAPYPAAEMAARPVGKFVNSYKNDGPECIEPTEGPPEDWQSQDLFV